MRATYRVTPLLAGLFALAVLTGSGILLGLGVRDTVRHVTADPARAAELLGYRARTRFADGIAAFATDPLRDAVG